MLKKLIIKFMTLFRKRTLRDKDGAVIIPTDENGLPFNVAFCKMVTNAPKSAVNGVIVTVTDFVLPMSVGGFVADTINNRLYIPIGTKYVKLSALISGVGYGFAKLRIVATDGSPPINWAGPQSQNLWQVAGNKYGQRSMDGGIIELNPEKAYYVYLDIAGYNETFTITSGFGNQSSWIAAEKLL